MREEVREELISTAERCESASFIEADPVRFPHRYSGRMDIEVSAFVSAWMAYGSRKVFLNVLERLHTVMNAAGGPYNYIMTGAWQHIPCQESECLYRFYKWADWIELCSRLQELYGQMVSLEELFTPSEPLISGVMRLCGAFNGVNGIPKPESKSANKRLYMFLRWMVRKDSPVDLGIWTRIKPAQLLVPVDTHVYTIAKELKLTSRHTADLKASIEITAQMAKIWPHDPARGDFALYGHEVMQDHNA